MPATKQRIDKRTQRRRCVICFSFFYDKNLPGGSRPAMFCSQECRVARLKAYQKAYRAANKEFYKEYFREWRKKHPRKYMRPNPEQRAAARARFQIKKLDAKWWFNRTQKRKLYRVRNHAEIVLRSKIYNARPEVEIRKQLYEARHSWIKQRLIAMARDDGTWRILADGLPASMATKLKRVRIISRLLAMARDDGIYGLLAKEYDDGERSIRQANPRSIHGEEYRREL